MRSLLIIATLLVVGVFCQDDVTEENLDVLQVPKNETKSKKERMFSFLQVLRFPNDVCAASNGRNGTCYSSDECTSKGGNSQGTCANGFGVCCVFSIGCGQTSSENNTYLVLSSTTAPSSSVCVYSLCENNPNICRIRLDFTSFVINGPVTGTARASAAAAGGTIPVNQGGAIGDCISDTFTLSAPNNRASPVICGTNSGQHMYIDTTSGSCARAVFSFGSSATTRQYDIKVTQYNCGDELAGPSDCLQFYTGNSGTVKSFNFNLVAGNVNGDATHLSNQLYSLCFRRNVGKCTLCFISSVNAANTITMQSSFGLSNTAAMTPMSGTDAVCSTDYLVIPNGNTPANAKNGDPGIPVNVNGNSRYCGRFFANGAASITTVSVCTGSRPFKIIFNTDANEVTMSPVAIVNSDTHEEVGAPAGIVGFSLDFVQNSC